MTTAPVNGVGAPPRPLRESTAEEIRSLMARRRLTGVTLAARIGRSQSYVSRRLTGETAFDVDDLERIAVALGVSVVALLPRTGVGQATVTKLAGGRSPRRGDHMSMRCEPLRPPIIGVEAA